MALETVGAVTGSLSTITLFTGVVDCFRYVQLGRHFADDYGKYRLQLDILELRMSRWGEAVGIHDDPLFASPNDKRGRLVLEILSQIKATFANADKTSQRYESQVDPGSDSGFCQPSDMDAAFGAHHDRFQQIVEKRQKETSFRKKFTWAIHHRSALDSMVNDLRDLASNLEVLFPAEMAARENQLLITEMKEIATHKHDLERLQHDGVEGLDPAMDRAIKQKLDASKSSFITRRIDLGDDGKSMAGHIVSPEFQGRELPGHETISTHTAEDIKTGKNARVLAGNFYGSANFFD
jgi:hypothetical protein